MTLDSRFGFYGILTQPVLGYEALAKAMVKCDVRFIQLRMKDTPRAEVLAMGKRLRPLIPRGIYFIINDDPELAREVGADGVHLGQDDMPYAEARALLGDGAMIGISTHNPDQAREACGLQPDYIGVGPVFATPTKKIPDPVIGLDGMREMLRVASVPAVAIGGIDLSNIHQVIDAGAANFSAVRCVNQAREPEKVLGQLQGVANGK